MASLFEPSLQRALDADGNPISGAQLFVYRAGTTTSATYYLDPNGATPGPNPLVADGAGIFPPVYLTEGLIYRIKVTDATGAATLYDVPLVYGGEPRVTVTYATRAALDADLEWPAGTTALVYDDSDPDNNTLYVKDGGIGAGEWLPSPIGQVANNLADINIVAARDADIGTVADRDADIGIVAARDPDIGTIADRDADIGTLAGIDSEIAALAPRATDIETLVANLSALTGASALAVNLLVMLGADATTITTQTVGTTTPNGATLASAAFAWGNTTGATYPGIITQVSLRAAAGTDTVVNLDFVRPGQGGQLIDKTISSVSFTAGGVRTVDIGMNYVEADTRLFLFYVSGSGWRYATGGASRTYTAADRASNPVTFAAQTFDLGFSYTIVQTTDATVNAKLALLVSQGTNLSALAAALGADDTTANHEYTAVGAATLHAGNLDFGASTPLTSPGWIYGFDADFTNGGEYGEIQLCRPSVPAGLSFTTIATRRFTTVAGSHTYTLSDPIYGQPGDVPFIRSLLGLVGYQSTAPSPARRMLSFSSSSSSTVGSVRTATSGTGAPAFTYRVREAADPKKVPAVACKANTHGPLLLHSQTFVSSGAMTTDSWLTTDANGISSVSNGLTFNGSGSYAHNALYNAYSHMGKKFVEAEFIANATGFQGGIMFQPNGNNGGTIFYLDDVAHTLSVRTQTATPGAGSLVQAATTISSMVSGHRYGIVTTKNGTDCTVTLMDLTTATAMCSPISVPWAGSVSLYAGMHGRPGVFHVAGNVTWKAFKVWSKHPRFLKAVFAGDSRCETGAGAGTVINTYAKQFIALGAARDNDIMSISRYGDTLAYQIDCLKTDAEPFFTEHLFIENGTNGGPTDIAAWLMPMIDFWRPRARRISLITIPPANPAVWSAQQAGFDTYNANIMSGLYGSDIGNVPVHIWTSTGNDGLTYNSAMIAADGLHENQTAHDLIFAGMSQMFPELVV